MMPRSEALEMVEANVTNLNLVKHMLAAEAIMRRLAGHFGQDVEKWGLAGLLHDIDRDVTGDDIQRHSAVAAEILTKAGVAEDIVYCVKVHNDAHGLPRRSLMDKALFAVDPLTGLGSRPRFDAYLADQFEFATRVGKPLSIILCDPDHFDMINQTFGREAGDRALQAVGRLLGERLRYRDLAARWGGEEFALLLTDTHAAGATVVAERLRKKIEDTQHDIGIGDPVRMTISVGCATLDEALTFARPEDLMLAVERALTQAKRSGRNRVATFADLSVAA